MGMAFRAATLQTTVPSGFFRLLSQRLKSGSTVPDLALKTRTRKPAPTVVTLLCQYRSRVETRKAPEEGLADSPLNRGESEFFVIGSSEALGASSSNVDVFRSEPERARTGERE